GYIYSAAEREVAVHLYVAGQAHLTVGGQKLELRQMTRYPWDGQVEIELTLEQSASFALRLRVPGWCRDARVAVNGAPVALDGLIERGYARLEREWHDADRVSLELDMPVERVYAHPDVRQDAGSVALMRGPLVYCFEQADQAQPVHRLRLPAAAPLEAHYEPKLLGGVVVITGQGQAAAEPADDQLY